MHQYCRSFKPPFLSNQGVKQSCILSPTLFNIFLADFQANIETVACNPVQIKGASVGCLIWADDILLMSKSKDGLQNMLFALKTYAEKNGMALNTKKTKVMIFNKTGRHLRREFHYGEEKLETVRQYKYLGFLVTPSGEINSGLKDLKDRAQRALSKLRKKMGITFREKPSLTLKIFSSLIEPILLYASDFWGTLKMPSNNPIETLFMSFCKQLLGVQKQTTNDGVLLELGLTPLLIRAKKRVIKNWVRLATNTNCNGLVIDSFQDSVEKNLPWQNKIEELVSELGLRQSFLDADLDLHLQVFQRLTDIYHQSALGNIKLNDSKLRTYSKLKTEPGFEKYLDEVPCVKKRIAFTKLRLSNHMLMIEKGRHLNIERTQRFCPFCPNFVEDERHFLLVCNQYRYIRQELLREVEVRIPLISNQCYDQRFLNLMTRVPTQVSNFIFNAMELREFLLAKHRVSD